MKFKLLFYTADDWSEGPEVELAHTPMPGSVVWVGKGRKRKSADDSAMYYVDNVMYPELGLDNDDAVYLYVRPYTGYGEYAPRTEIDRVTERLAKVTEELRAVREELSELNLRAKSLNENISSVGADIDDRQHEISEQLGDAIFALEGIKKSME